MLGIKAYHRYFNVDYSENCYRITFTVLIMKAIEQHVTITVIPLYHYKNFAVYINKRLRKAS